MRLSLFKAACALYALGQCALMSGCVFIKTGLSEEERLRLQAPDKTVVTYVKENLDAAQSYVDNFDNHGFQVGKRISQCMRERAEAVGVLEPDRIRVVVQDELPRPNDAKLLQLFEKIRINKAGALTLGHSIYMKPRFARSYNVLIHEFVHVTQMEAMGKIKFIEEYGIQSLSLDYYKVPLEAEAFTKAALITANSGITQCTQLYEQG
jgi:hypothetical protein